MTEVYAFLAEGMEEVECLATVDVLARAGIKVTLVSIGEKKKVKGAHGFKIKADVRLEDADLAKADVLFLPGGMPGTKHLRACEPLCEALIQAEKEGKRLAAICAAPSVFGELGLLKGKKATCYPGWEASLEGAIVTGEGVVTDGTITTAKGLGYALDLGLELVSLLINENAAQQIQRAIQYDRA